MALSRLRPQSLSLLPRRYFSANAVTSSSKDKTRAALFLLKSEKNPEKIIDICRSASLTPDLHLDRIAFSVAISKLRETNNLSYIDSFLTELRTSRPDLQTERFAAYSIVLYGQANMLNHAISAFKEYHKSLKDLNKSGVALIGSVKALNALLFACILCKKFDELKRVYIDYPRLYNIQLNLESYNTLIKGFCESGNSSAVYSVLEEMRRKGVTPNATSFGHLIAGFYKEEKFDDVGKALKMMQEDYGIRVGINIYNIRIQSLCKLGKSNEAKALLEGLLARDKRPNSGTYHHLVHGFGKEGNLEEAKRLFNTMKNKGFEPEADCYFTLVYFLCRGKDFDTAYEICMESINKKWVPNFGAMKMLVQGLAGVGKVDEAKNLIGMMKETFKKNKSVELWDEVEAGLPQ